MLWTTCPDARTDLCSRTVQLTPTQVSGSARIGSSDAYEAGHVFAGKYVVQRTLGEGGLGVVFGILQIRDASVEMLSRFVELAAVRRRNRWQHEQGKTSNQGVRDAAHRKSMLGWSRQSYKSSGDSRNCAVFVARDRFNGSCQQSFQRSAGYLYPEAR